MHRSRPELLIFSYVVLFILTFLTNKYVLTVEGFAYPAVFQSWQVFAGFVGFLLTVLFSRWKWHVGCFVTVVQYTWKTIPFYTLSIYAGSRALTTLSIFFNPTSKQLVAFISVAVSSMMLVITVPKNFGNAMWWMLLHVCSTGIVLAHEKIFTYCSKTDTFNRQVMHYISSFVILLPTSYILGDFHAVQHYPFLSSPAFWSTFVISGIVGCLLALIHQSALRVDIPEINLVGLAKALVSLLSLVLFGLPPVPERYLFWTTLSLFGAMFLPKASNQDSNICSQARARCTLEHV
ncbi:UDP-N-acetylglucosamine transporter TMEM241 homolog isoform X2 [Ornithodoros turicata]|uniref:UDP-N-acetylglucosamine transporter TMEM241 homolog isoform X2 n=1 Tax=Ornithodoros turicata TaxID=34597 RepID=UPI003139731D